MSLHSVAALEESFNLTIHMPRLVGCELIYSNITPIVVVDLSFVKSECMLFVEAAQISLANSRIHDLI